MGPDNVNDAIIPRMATEHSCHVRKFQTQWAQHSQVRQLENTKVRKCNILSILTIFKRYPTRQVAIGTMAVYDVTRVTIPENQVGSMAYDVENYSLAMTYLTLLDGISW